MPLSLRYVDTEGIIQKKFIQFIECDTGISAVELSKKILLTILKLGLDTNNVRGQGYAGASNMSVKNAGTAKLIQNLYILAINIHCFSHRLYLCVAGSCNLLLIKNMFDTVRVFSEFFEWPKRAELIKKYCPEERLSVLLDVCKLRWIARIDGIDQFEEMYEVIM